MKIVNIIPDFFKGSDDMLNLIGSFDDIHHLGLKAGTDGLHVRDSVTDCVECRNEGSCVIANNRARPSFTLG